MQRNTWITPSDFSFYDQEKKDIFIEREAFPVSMLLIEKSFGKLRTLSVSDTAMKPWKWILTGRIKTGFFCDYFCHPEKWNVYTSLCQFIIFALWITFCTVWCVDLLNLMWWIERKTSSHPSLTTGILNHPKWIICLLHFLFFKNDNIVIVCLVALRLL